MKVTITVKELLQIIFQTSLICSILNGFSKLGESQQKLISQLEKSHEKLASQLEKNQLFFHREIDKVNNQFTDFRVESVKVDNYSRFSEEVGITSIISNHPYVSFMLAGLVVLGVFTIYGSVPSFPSFPSLPSFPSFPKTDSVPTFPSISNLSYPLSGETNASKNQNLPIEFESLDSNLDSSLDSNLDSSLDSNLDSSLDSNLDSSLDSNSDSSLDSNSDSDISIDISSIDITQGLNANDITKLNSALEESLKFLSSN
jgi:hypothetical protein